MKWIVLGSLLLTSGPASAELVSATVHGFHVRHTADLPVERQKAFDLFVDVASWWDGSHTYSGSASNMSLSPVPGGCFCERLQGGGGVEHMRVAYVAPGERIVLTGSLGPLLYEATTGAMDVRLEPADGGTRVTLDYKVAGFASGNAEQIGPAVDQVIGHQVARLAAAAKAPASP